MRQGVGIVRSYLFTVQIDSDIGEDGRPAFHAFCPALQGCHTWGRSYQEALVRVQEAAELYVQDLVEAGQPVPTDATLGPQGLPNPAVAVNL